MSATLEPPPQADAQDAEALFREARMVARRRRRRRVAVVAVVGTALAAAGAGFGLAERDSGGRGAHPPRLVVDARVRSAALPASGRFDSLAVVGGKLVVSGGRSGSGLPSGSAPDGGHCDAAVVNPTTLRVGPLRHGACADPGLYGEHVLPVEQIVSHRGPTGLVRGVRIAVVDHSRSRGYRLGPLLFRYDYCSDCGDQWIYGDGALWVYDAATMSGAQLLEISERSGAVLRRIPMPKILTPLLAVNEGGLWLAPSILSGFPAGVSASARRRYEMLYRVGVRGALRAVMAVGSAGARFMVAAGHRIWLDDGNDAVASSQAVLLDGFGVESISDEPNALQWWRGSSSYAADVEIGAWHVVEGAPTQTVLRVGGGGQLVADIHPRHPVDTAAVATAAFGRAFFILDPAQSAALGYPGAPRRPGLLYRVSP